VDLLAALALMILFEGLALAVFARSIPQMVAELDRVGPDTVRRIGLIGIALGAVLYLLVRGG